jgi:N-acetylmuramoyl-L-alanine amidase
MKQLFILILVLTPLKEFSNIPTKNDFKVNKTNLDLLYQTVWNEARGEDTMGIKLVIDVVKNRVSSNKFPNSLDSVLIQPFQFASNHVDSIPKRFKTLVDILYHQPIQYPYLYFINPKKAQKTFWIKNRKWVKYKNHAFAL